MSALTAILYAALAIYLGGWYADQWIGNFSLLASGPSAEPTVKELEEKLARLKKEVEIGRAHV